MAKIIGLKQIFMKNPKKIEGLSDTIISTFGQLIGGFVMIIWGQSGSGKSNFIMAFIREMMCYGNVLYVGLEEGFGASMQIMANRHLDMELHSGKIQFSDHNMTYDALITKLKKKKSPKCIVIDSLQYWGITYIQYKELKELFPCKIFIFISHAKGKKPDGSVADKIRYDAGIKVHVEGYIAFIISRYGGSSTPYIIWEDGAKRYWGGKKFNQFKK